MFIFELEFDAMKRYFIKLAYNGTNYHGWQIQDNADTVQAEVNEKLSLLLGEKINVVGCGRTDAGVHARTFYAHFDIARLNCNPDELSYKLDRFLPTDIVVYNIFKVKPDFHSRFSAVSRTYRYYISRTKDPFCDKQCYYFHGTLDIEAMKAASHYLFEFEDFTSFSKLHTQTATNNCVISEAIWEEKNGKMIFTITADRFLRNMVRAIVGTLLEIGKGKLKVEDMKNIIEARDRSKAGFSVPAQGLFLEKVKYPFNVEV